MQGLIKMLSKGNVKASDYLVANPFSTIANEKLDGFMTKEIFFSKLFDMPFLYVERIAKILEVSEDSCQNTIFVTGFRGCGKTTFANFVASLINSEISMSPCSSDLLTSISSRELNKRIFELRKIFKRKIDSDIDDSFDCLSELSEADYESILQQVNTYIDYINEHLAGKAIYLNFESGVTEPEYPFEQKLNSNLKKLIARIIDNKANKEVVNILVEISDLFGLTTFEQKDNYYFKEFFEFADKKLRYVTNSKDVLYEVNKAIAPLKTNQLLSLIVLLDLAYMEIQKDYKKVYYIFDNIDVIFDTRILNNFVQQYAYFADNMSDLFGKITEKGIFKRTSSFHSDFCFIFIMRETSTMLIADHFNDRLRKLAIHFDISSDVDHGAIVSKKLNLLEDMAETYKLDSKIFIFFLDTIRKINMLCSDQYIKNNIFTMFNNDFKRAILCLAPICEDYPKLIQEFIELKDQGDDFAKHGSRGIIFRLIFDHFDKKLYFEHIGVVKSGYKKPNFTVARIILLYLNSIQYDHSDCFIFDDRDRVSLNTMYDALKDVLSDNEKQATDLFLNSLLEMYNLRISDTWSHLITFDSIKSVDVDEIRPVINSVKHTNKSNLINVRITCSGRNYIRFIASHFEFFSCRFLRKAAPPLFSYSNGTYNRERQEYNFERVIEGVYNAMEKCCQNLLSFEENRLVKGLGLSRNELLETYEFLYIDKEKEYALLHEERYIHQHIRYIDAYRMYLINGRYDNNVSDINQRIIKYIRKYIMLLKNNKYFSNLSLELADELYACVTYIESLKYECSGIEISKDAYRNLPQIYKEKSLNVRT